jgi:O-antigen/teichoic acid export membrane protein
VIIKSTLIGILSKATALAGSFFLIPYMILQLGDTRYGIWVTISSMLGLLSFMDMGIGNSLTNALAHAGQNQLLIRGYITLALRFQLILSGILCTLFLGIAFLADWNALIGTQTPEPGLSTTVLIAGVFFISGTLTNTIYAIQRGLQRTEIANGWQLAGSIAYILALWAALRFSGELYWIATAAFGTPFLVSLINLSWFLFSENLLGDNIPAAIAAEKKNFFRTGGWFMYLQVAAVIAFQTDAIIIAHVLNLEDVSRYSVASRLFSVPLIIMNIYLQNLWPVYARQKAGEAGQLFKRSMLLTVSATILFCAGILLFKEAVFTIWLKNRLNVPWPLAISMAAWTTLNIIDMNISTALNAMNLLKVQAVLAALMIASSAGLSIWLGSRMGVEGVVWGTAIATLVCSTIPMGAYLGNVLKKKPPTHGWHYSPSPEK